ncbi:MAG: PQQ-binding-like beta-propeller repeat protein [Candidatus Sericytochromatia bacterium]
MSCFLLNISCSNTTNTINQQNWKLKQFRDAKITIVDINNDKIPDIIASGYQRGGKTDLKKILYVESDLKKFEEDTGKWEGRGHNFYIDKEYKLWVKVNGKSEKVKGNSFKSNVSALIDDKGKLEILYNDKRENVKNNKWEIPALKIWVDDGNRLWVQEYDNKIIARSKRWKRTFTAVVNPLGEYIRGTGLKRGGKLDKNRIPIGDCVAAVDGKTQKILWSFQTRDSIENYPSYSNGKVFVGGKDRSFYAIDAHTGKLSWKFITEDIIDTTAAISKNKLFFGNKFGRFYALDTNRGHLLWSFSARAGIDSSPAVYENRVYFGSWDKRLYCLNANNGKILWKQDLPSYIGKSSPLIYNDKVIIGCWDKNVYAFDYKSGKTEWVFKTDDWIDKASPVAGNGLVYIGNKKGVLYAIYPETGAMKWEYNTGDAITSSPVVTKNRLYLNSRDGYVYALNPLNGQKIWENKIRYKMFSSPAVSDNRVFYSSLNGNLSSINDYSMGKVIWPMFGGDPEHKNEFSSALSYGKKMSGKKSDFEKFLEDNNLKPKS